MARAEEHIAELLKLSVDERANAARLLLDSLGEEPSDAVAQQARVEEILRRAHSVGNGTAKLVEPGVARERVLARLRQARSK